MQDRDVKVELLVFFESGVNNNLSKTQQIDVHGSNDFVLQHFASDYWCCLVKYGAGTCKLDTVMD